MSWKLQAICRGMDPDIFFPERGDPARLAVAKSYCAQCPVTAECIEEAMVTNERSGVRGGLSGAERRAMARAKLVPDRKCVCLHCDAVFLGWPQSKICSEKCRQERMLEHKRIGRRASR